MAWHKAKYLRSKTIPTEQKVFTEKNYIHGAKKYLRSKTIPTKQKVLTEQNRIHGAKSIQGVKKVQKKILAFGLSCSETLRIQHECGATQLISLGIPKSPNARKRVRNNLRLVFWLCVVRCSLDFLCLACWSCACHRVPCLPAKPLVIEPRGLPHTDFA